MRSSASSNLGGAMESVDSGEAVDLEKLFESWNKEALSMPWYVKAWRWVARKFSDRRFRWNPGIIWWVRHRTTDRYNVVSTGLPPGYYDKDIQMLHACFSLLVDFVERECDGVSGVKRQVRYGGHHGAMATECLALYWWWTEIRPRRGEEDFDMEDVYDAKDDEMLGRLVKIRRWLWT